MGKMLGEADLRAYARQKGFSYEEVLWRSGWHDGFSREVVGRIDRESPGTYVQHAYGTADGNKRSARIGFYGDIDEGIQAILDDYSEANEVEIEVSTNLGFRRRDMEEAVPLVYYFLMGSEDVSGGSGHSDWDLVSGYGAYTCWPRGVPASSRSTTRLGFPSACTLPCRRCVAGLGLPVRR